MSDKTAEAPEAAPVEEAPAYEPTAASAITDGPPAPDQATRDAVTAASDDIHPGQTITTKADGSVIVTGTPAADPDAPADHTITAHGDSVLIDTPLGRVEVRLEVDSEGSFGLVSVNVNSFEGASAAATDQVVLRSAR